MRYSRHTRFLAAMITLFSLLFTQLAVAAYACPQVEAALGQAAAANSMAAMPDCPSIDKQSPNLCDAHDKVGSQSLDHGGQPSLQAFIPLRMVLALSPVDRDPPLVPGVPIAFLESASSSPPISIRHCCFRN
jgi:hypothetical protein